MYTLFCRSFGIDNNTGAVTVTSNQTDREREDRYYMVVVATDGGGLQQTVPLTVSISDRNDNPPVFRRDQYDVILNEDDIVFSRSTSVTVEVSVIAPSFFFFFFFFFLEA